MDRPPYLNDGSRGQMRPLVPAETPRWGDRVDVDDESESSGSPGSDSLLSDTDEADDDEVLEPTAARHNGGCEPAVCAADLYRFFEGVSRIAAVPKSPRLVPVSLNVRLYPYQLDGLAWARGCEEGPHRGGILADDIGLGKTVQMVSLLVCNKPRDRVYRATLIIASDATLVQWSTELRDKVHLRHRPTVHIHRGGTADYRSLRQYDVVLTTMETLVSEWTWSKTMRRPRGLPSAGLVLLHPKAKWHRVILDDAHRMRYRGGRETKAACALAATYRFAVTGTPITNNLEDLFPLIRFLRFEPYCSWDTFHARIIQPFASKDNRLSQAATDELAALCSKVLLRRAKDTAVNGRPIVRLPPQAKFRFEITLSEEEAALYAAHQKHVQGEIFNRGLQGENERRPNIVLSGLRLLRQAGCHPLSIQDLALAQEAHPSRLASKLATEPECVAGLDPIAVARVLDIGTDLFECSICYNITLNPVLLVPCAHHVCRHCAERLANDTIEGRRASNCPFCRTKVDLSHLPDFAGFEMAYMAPIGKHYSLVDVGGGGRENEFSMELFSDDYSSTEGESEDDDDLTPSPTAAMGSPARCTAIAAERYYRAANAFVREHIPGSSASHRQIPTSVRPQAVADRSEDARCGRPQVHGHPAGSKMERMRRLRARHPDWTSSTKIDKAMDFLRDLLHGSRMVKVLVFSQWTSLLNLLEVPMALADFNYRRYDGSTTKAQRERSLADFRDEAEGVQVLLLSFAAGGTGLDLAMASQVLFLEPVWMPHIEELAIGRAHRLGQTRPVSIYTIVAKDTVEDRLVALQDHKRARLCMEPYTAEDLRRGGSKHADLSYLLGGSSGGYGY